MSEDPAKPNPWDELRRLADEARVKVHLASMDLRDRWKAFEPQLHDLEQKIEQKIVAASDQAEDAVAKQVDAVAAGLRRFVDEIRDAASKK